MPFSPVIFVTAVWALLTEMVEDAVVDLVYGRLFGWTTLVYAILIATAMLATDAAALIIYAPIFLELYLGWVQKGAAVLMGAVGAYWLARSATASGERIQSSAKGDLLSAVKFVAVEELEVLLIVVPLALASYVEEAATAAGLGVVLSLGAAFVLRKRFAEAVEGQMRLLKVGSGVLLLATAAAIFVFG